nr:YitT family protein [Ligilactobacillus hayakitensis]
MNNKIQRNPWFRWVVLVLALEIITLSINFFYAPINIAAGGATGIAILVDAVWGINRSLTVLIFNILMIVLALIFLDKKTVKNITIGSFLLPLLMEITPSFQVTNNELLAVIYGGGLMGFGVALLYRINASSGGTTVPPMILKKYFYINSAISLLVIDMIVICMNVFVDGLNAFFLAAFSQLVTAMVMRYTESGLDHKYQVEVMSNKYTNEIKKMLMENYNGLTVYNVVGGYSEDQKQQLLLVVDTQDYGPLIRQIHEIDPDAFIVTSNVMNVHGGRWGL